MVTPSTSVRAVPTADPLVAQTAPPIPTVLQTLKQEAIAVVRPLDAVADEPVASPPAVVVVVASEPRADDASVAATPLRATRHSDATVANIQNETVKEPPNKSPSEMSQTAPRAGYDVAPSVARHLPDSDIPESTMALAAHETTQTNATLASATDDKPQPTESPVQSQAGVSAPSADAVSRIDLARQRVRELGIYFGRLNTPPPPVWNDASTETGAEQQRSALHGRAQLQAAGDFDVDTITWRMSENATAVNAEYHLHRGRNNWESGRFSLEMIWREKMWLVTRVELVPAP
jgi:hypothetical protein